MKKKFLSVLLSLGIVLTLLPINVLAGTAITSSIWDGALAESYAGGSGTESDPYQIATGPQLKKLANDTNASGFYILTDDIYLNDVRSENWYNANNVNVWSSIVNFNGTFDGQGYCIYGLYPTSLFGEANGIIKNTNIAKAFITEGYVKGGTSYIGAIAGFAENVSGCSNSGIVSYNGKDSTLSCVGGIAGYAHNIDQCYNVGSIYGADTSSSGGNTVKVGGIVGQSGFTVSNCYNTGDILARSYYPSVGGIIGDASSGTYVNSCYSIPVAQGKKYYGDIVGLTFNKSKATLTACYCSNVLVGEALVKKTYGEFTAISCGVLSDSEMQERASYVGFDFESIWNIGANTNSGYPTLRQVGNGSTGDDSPAPVEQITFKTDNGYSVYIGNDLAIVASVRNGDSLTKNDITWSSDNETVATVTPGGVLPGNPASATAMIEGISRGTAAITISLADGRTASCNITVDTAPNTIQLSTVNSMLIGTSQSMTAQIKLNTINVSDEIVWISSDNSILSFDDTDAKTVSHPISGMTVTDSKITDSVIMYARAPGKVTVTCKLQTSGIEESFQILVYKEAKEAFETLRDEYLRNAYNNYIRAVTVVLKEKQDEVLELTIDQQAQALMEQDEGAVKLITFEGTYGQDEMLRENVYKAAAQFLADVTCSFDLEKVRTGGAKASSISLSIVNAIIEGIDISPRIYHFEDNVTVELKNISVNGTHFRDVYYKKGNGKSTHVATLISKPDQIQNSITEYIEQLIKLEENLVKEAYKQVKKEFARLGFKGLETLTKDAATELLGPHISAFEKTGVGKVTTAVSATIDYYHFIEKVISLGNQDPLTLLSDLDSIKDLSFEPTSITDKAVGATVKPLEKAGNLVWKAFNEYIRTGDVNIDALLKGWADSSFTGVVETIACPVNVAVYTSDGKQVGYAGDDDVWYDEDIIYIEKHGDAKIVYSHNGNLQLEMVGTDYGTLNCTFEEYSSGEAVGRVNYYNILLYKGKNISASVLSKTINRENVIVTEETTQIDADEELNANEYNSSTVTITCSASPTNGGQISGSGTFVRGDLVDLQAIAENGYVFVGWQDSDGNLLSVDDYYEFTAQKHLDLTATFVKYVQEPVLYAIAFDANGGSVDSNVIATKVDGTLAILPIPTRNGYTFSGWYTPDGAKVSTDTVFVTNTTITARWTKSNFGYDTMPDPIVPNYNPGGFYVPPTYGITTPSVIGGKVSVSPTSASAGSTVTITAMPEAGYELAALTVADANDKNLELTNKGNGQYSFKMPNGRVSINAEFKPVSIDVPWNNPFVDVSIGNWYYDAVKFVNQNGLMNGVGSGLFAPNAQLSRAMLAEILYNKEGRPVMSGGTSAFPDVPLNEWYADAVSWAYGRGIIKGYDNGLFGPGDDITREQLAVMLYRYAGSPVPPNLLLNFTDAYKVSDWAQHAVRWAVDQCILNGKGNGILDPTGKATRAEAAQMLKNYLDK